MNVANGRVCMPLYWLVYRHNNQISVVIEPGPDACGACFAGYGLCW